MKRIIMIAVLFFITVSISGCGDNNSVYDDDSAIAMTGDNSSTKSASSVKVLKDLSVKATLTGSRTVWRYNANKETDVPMSYSLSVSEGGRAKLVLITPDDEVIILTENTDNTTVNEMQSQTISLKPGVNRIKIVGNDAAKFELKLHIEVGELDW